MWFCLSIASFTTDRSSQLYYQWMHKKLLNQLLKKLTSSEARSRPGRNANSGKSLQGFRLDPKRIRFKIARNHITKLPPQKEGKLNRQSLRAHLNDLGVTNCGVQYSSEVKWHL
jgi:hypothetical protein